MRFPAIAVTAMLASGLGQAQAALTVSDAATRHVSCVLGICTATAERAFLNVGELETMLGTGGVTLVSASAAKDIVILRPVAWTGASTLGLDSYRGIEFDKIVSVEGPGGLALRTNDGGIAGDIRFVGMARVVFWDLAGSLTMQGNAYTLVGDVAGLAAGVASTPSGRFALANNYDARVDGVYSTSPVGTPFGGRFEGLGNTISNLSIKDPSYRPLVGLFRNVLVGGSLRDINLVNAKVQAKRGADVGTLAGGSAGDVSYATATGFVKCSRNALSGGLVGSNSGMIYRSQARVTMPGGSGGLVSENSGTISQSFASPTITAGNAGVALLVAGSRGSILDCYATGSASADGSVLAGLTDFNIGTLTNSYVAGTLTDLGVTAKGDVAAYNQGSMSHVYWDTTTTDLGLACEPGIYDCPEAVGLSDAELKSALPAGFDPAFWGLDPAINGGLPYLLNNPPR